MILKHLETHTKRKLWWLGSKVNMLCLNLAGSLEGGKSLNSGFTETTGLNAIHYLLAT